MEDRLAELRVNLDIRTSQLNSNESQDKGGPDTLETETDELMPDFNKKVNQIHFHLKKIRQNTEQVTALKERHSSATLAEAEKGTLLRPPKIIIIYPSYK